MRKYNSIRIARPHLCGRQPFEARALVQLLWPLALHAHSSSELRRSPPFPYSLQRDSLVTVCMPSWDSTNILSDFLKLHKLWFILCAVKFHGFWQMHDVMCSLQNANSFTAPQTSPVPYLLIPLSLNPWQPLIFLPSLWLYLTHTSSNLNHKVGSLSRLVFFI